MHLAERNQMRQSSVEKIIIEILSMKDSHRSSQQIYEEIRNRLPAVNPSTVYRALDRMVDHGIVSVSDIGQGALVFEILTNDLHHHLVCSKCGKLTTIGQGQVEDFFLKIESENNFKILTNHLILFGICGDCKKSGLSD